MPESSSNSKRALGWKLLPREELLLPEGLSGSLSSYVVGIDPGGTIGYAGIKIRSGGHADLIFADEVPAEEAPRLLHAISETGGPGLHLAIEDYVGSGPRDKNSVQAIMLIGAFMGVGVVSGATIAVRAPQLRRAFLGKAATLAGDMGSRHSIDALAHALAYAHDVLKAPLDT